MVNGLIRHFSVQMYKKFYISNYCSLNSLSISSFDLWNPQALLDLKALRNHTTKRVEVVREAI